jgi:hypothetical protein
MTTSAPGTGERGVSIHAETDFNVSRNLLQHGLEGWKVLITDLAFETDDPYRGVRVFPRDRSGPEKAGIIPAFFHESLQANRFQLSLGCCVISNKIYISVDTKSLLRVSRKKFFTSPPAL